MSATDCYTSGKFDDALLLMLRRYDDVMSIMLPSLGEERQKTYSPFLPVCQKTGRVLQDPAGFLTYRQEGAISFLPLFSERGEHDAHHVVVTSKH